MIKYLSFFFFLAAYTFAQSNKHVNVPGTKCRMIPPAGFLTATTFAGFQNTENGASIMINEIPAPYENLVAGFTEQALKTRGMTLIKKQTIVFNGTNATWVELSQSANGLKYLKQMLVFGNDKSTLLVNGIYPESAKEIQENIKEAILSTVFDDLIKDDALSAANFTINVDSSDFKVIKYLSGSLLYSTDGKIPTEKPTLIVASSFSKSLIVDRRMFARDRIKSLPNSSQLTIIETNDLMIDDLPGVEIIASGVSSSSKTELVYQVMLFTPDDDYFILIGQAKEDMSEYLEIFKRIARTFRRK